MDSTFSFLYFFSLVFLIFEMLNSSSTCTCIDSQHYVQAPEAHPVPDGRTSSGMQQHPQQQKIQQQQQQHQQENQQLHHLSSSHNTNRQSTDHNTALKRQDSQSQGRKPSFSNMSTSSMDIPYDISWIFPRLRSPSTLWYIASQFVVTLVGIFSKILLGKYSKYHL